MTDVARLHDLQKIDTNWEKVRRRLLQLQKLLAEPEDVRAARESMAQIERALHEWQAHQQVAELEAQGLAERIKTTDQKLMSGTVRNPKELETLQASAEALRRQRAAVEEQGLEALLQVEEHSAHLAANAATLEKLEAAWKSKHDELLQDEAKYKRYAVQLKAQRARLVQEINGADLELYEDLRKRKAGLAVAKVENGLCLACNVRVPTGIASLARSGAEAVFCPSCGRILVA